MKKIILSVTLGIAAGLICFSLSVSAAGGIKSVFFNDNKISYNGSELNLSGERMVTVIPEGSSYDDNYIPMRKTLEAMGFSVQWDEMRNAVLITGY